MIKKGDNVIVKAGKDRGKQGKVARVLRAEDRVVVEGVNVRKKHQRARRSNEKGQVMEMPMPIHISNVMLYCSSCGKGVRMKAKDVKGKKVRACVKCGKEL